MNTRLLPIVFYTIVLLLSLFCHSCEVHAETLEIALPDLIGLYSTDGVTSRADTFQLNKSPTSINNAWIRLTGVHHVSSYTCEDGGSIGPWFVILNAVIPDVVTPAEWIARASAPWDYGSALPNPIPYDFETTITFVPTAGATWDFLAALLGTISLDCEPYYNTNPHCYFYYPDAPHVEITEAVLVLEGEFSVGVKESSWGAIKAIYSQ